MKLIKISTHSGAFKLLEKIPSNADLSRIWDSDRLTSFGFIDKLPFIDWSVSFILQSFLLMQKDSYIGS